MILNLDYYLEDFEGNRIGEQTLAKIIASVFAGAFDDLEPMRCIAIGENFWKKGEADLNKDELEKIKNYITKSKDFPNLTKASIISKIIDCSNKGEQK